MLICKKSLKSLKVPSNKMRFYKNVDMEEEFEGTFEQNEILKI